MPLERYVAIFTMIAGSGLLLVACRHWLRARSSRKWPSVLGVLEEASVEEHENVTRSGLKYKDYDLKLL
jgi:hypothetical protein